MAVTTQVSVPVVDNTSPTSEHPVPLTAKLTAIVPEPPALVRVMGEPAVPVVTELVMLKGLWATNIRVLTKACLPVLSW